MVPIFNLTHGKYWIFNQVQVMGFQISQDYVIEVSYFQICSKLSLNVILRWESHFLGWLPDFYIALQAFNVFYIFLPCLIFWKCCFSLCWKKWLIILKNKYIKMGYICFFVLCYNWAYKYTISHQEFVFFSVIKSDGSWLIHKLVCMR